MKLFRGLIFLIDERLRELSEAWGLPLSALMEAMTSDKNDDDRGSGEMGGRQPANARPPVDGAVS